MKTLINIYSAVIGKAEMLSDHTLRSWLTQVRDEHKSTAYFIKKRIITDNLYGVDIMEEATEIAKLRLFLALVASAQSLEELEPLPNIDFNVMAGNSLIGLIRVDGERFDAVAETRKQRERKAQQARWGQETQTNLVQEIFVQTNLLQPDAVMTYRQILDEKNQRIRSFKNQAFRADDSTEPESETATLKEKIETQNDESQTKLNQLLFDEFGRLEIKFEQAQVMGKPKKRFLEMKDINRLEPFHWGYHFDQIINERGGFDAIIANPPWEVFQTNEKEFFNQYSDIVTRKMMNVFEFTEKRDELLQDPDIQRAWLSYCSQFPHQNAYFKKAEQYSNQTSYVNGKKIPGKNNANSNLKCISV